MENELIIDSAISIITELSPEEKEAVASLTLNETFRWAKFILTDNKPNANNQRIPDEEFDNVINTGQLSPIKMARGKINEGHDEAEPIGVVAQLKRVGEQIIGLAALWTRERPEDVAMIKSRYDKGEPLHLSWEMMYSEASLSDDGIEDLHGVTMRAVTLVGLPAYQGRTTITAVASETNKPSEETKLEELEQLKITISELQTKLADKETEYSALLTEAEQLRAFKSEIETAKAAEEKLAAIKQKFSEMKIEKDDKYFSENREMLLSLADNTLEFMLQELVAFSTVKPETNSSTNLPPISSGHSDSLSDPIEIGKALRESK